MTIPDRVQAEHYLSHISYYRLRPYWQSFETDCADHKFAPGTNFDHALSTYIFDRELRLILLDAIERIEISARTRWMQVLTEAHGSHPHLNSSLFTPSGNPKWNYDRAIDDLTRSFAASRENFAAHFREKYQEKLPPLWGTCELMTFGEFSKWYSNTNDSRLRQKVAKFYDIDEAIFSSFLHHLSYIRNLCAHHARLWDRHLTIKWKLPNKNPADVARTINKNQKSSLYNTIVMMKHLMDKINPDSDWHQRIDALISGSNINSEQMGFPQKPTGVMNK